MKVLKSLRRRSPRAARAEKAIAGFVRALGKLCPAKGDKCARATRSKA